MFVLACQIVIAQIPKTISYQGVLTNSDGTPVADGNYKITFGIHIIDEGGSEVWMETHNSVVVANGIFNVILGSIEPLDLPFDLPYWLGIRIGEASELMPRVPLTSSPYSLNALSASNAWRLTGNIVTTASNFLGTTNDQSLELRVNSIRALLIQPNAASPNLIGGYLSNGIKPGIYGAVIGGGGVVGDFNYIMNNYCTIGGGFGNQAGNDEGIEGKAATIGGGGNNTATEEYATVSGGANNTADRGAAVGGGEGNAASGIHSAIGGGWSNTASMSNSTVGGGYLNEASGWVATIGGGYSNVASGDDAIIGGGGHNQASALYATIGGGGGGDFLDGNVVADDYGTVSGGRHNQAGNDTGTMEDAAYATVGGGKDNTAYSLGATVGGGGSNIASNTMAAIAGGGYNQASGIGTTAVGGMYNKAIGPYSTVGGGTYNWAHGEYSTIGGGGSILESDGNQVTDDGGTVSGGTANQAGNGETSTTDTPYATVSGGTVNTASGEASTIGGGSTNTANSIGATIAGGWNNAAMANFATVAGGGSDTIGKGNRATQPHSTVSGGFNNIASGEFATVCGGGNNTAGGYSGAIAGGVWNEANGQFSFAAGRQAKSNHDGCFVWGDSNAGNVESSDTNQFIARSTGGVYFYTNSGLTAGMYLGSGGSSWNVVSDRELKRNIRQVDGKEILTQLAQIPISQWSYKAQDSSIEHIGPMAQDFYDAFGLGADDKHINTIDPDGVALAAIQGLYELVKEKDEKIANQQQQMVVLEERLAFLESLILSKEMQK